MLYAVVGACGWAGGAQATDDTWKNAANGDFSNFSNWNPSAPGMNDRALFTNTGTYSVTFTTGFVYSAQAVVSAGNVSFLSDAQSTTPGAYSLGTNLTSLIVGQTAGKSGALTLEMAAPFGNYGLTAGNVVIGSVAQSAGTLNAGGLVLFSGILTVGDAGSGTLNVTTANRFQTNNVVVAAQAGSTGTVGVTGVWNGSGSIALGNGSNPAGHDTFNISGGSVAFINGNITINASGKLNLTSGSLATQSIVGGNTSTLNFSGGTLSLTQSDLTLNPAGLLGATEVLDSTKGLLISGTTTVPTGGLLSVAGGSFSTDVLVNSGGTIHYTSGALSVGSGGLVIDALSGPLKESDITLQPFTDSITCGAGDGSAGALIIGRSGSARLSVAGGQVLSYSDTYLAALPGSSAQVNVGGTNGGFSSMTVGGALIVGGQMSGGTSVAGGSATLTINPSGSVNSGLTRVYGGSAVKVNGQLTVQNLEVLPGATLTGAGTINPFNPGATFVNSGHVGPGDGVGVLTDSTSYTQTSSGALDIEIAGAGVAGTVYDLLHVQGAASLDGLLGVTFNNGFVSSTGDVFDILTADGGLTGTFANATPGGIVVVSGRELQVAYSAGDVTLTDVGAIPEPAVCTLIGGVAVMFTRRKRRMR